MLGAWGKAASKFQTKNTERRGELAFLYGENQMSHPIEQLEKIMTMLRDPKSGCPWDIKQTFDTIVPHTIEETYEVVDAIQKRDWNNLKEELGDLLFQVVFYSQLAKEQKLFDLSDVVDTVNEKLTRRHPHVFSEKKFDSEAEVSAYWQEEKQREKSLAGKTSEGVLGSIPDSLPALMRAVKIQSRCAEYGFDWNTLDPVVGKVHEEIDEVLGEVERTSVDRDKLEMEMGDLLFAVVNLSRHLGTHPEIALAKANTKFTHRFKAVERLVAEKGKRLEDYELEQLDKFWEQVKMQEMNKCEY